MSAAAQSKQRLRAERRLSQTHLDGSGEESEGPHDDLLEGHRRIPSKKQSPQNERRVPKKPRTEQAKGKATAHGKIDQSGTDDVEEADEEDEDSVELPDEQSPSDHRDSSQSIGESNLDSGERVVDINAGQTGYNPDSGSVGELKSGKKRTMSAILLEEHDEDGIEAGKNFPRKRLDRKPSSSGSRLQYNQIEVAALRALAAEAKAAEAALASDDDDDIYKQLDEAVDDSDDDSLMDNPEEDLLAASDVETENRTPKQNEDVSASENEAEDLFDEFKLSAKIDNFFGVNGFLTDVDAYDGNSYIPSFLQEPTTPRRKSESSERRVRFHDEVTRMESSSSSSSSSEFDVDTFPDLLDALDRDPIVPQDSLDQVLLHQIEGHDDEYDVFGAYEGSDGAGSEYDFGENEAAMHVFKRSSKANAPSEGPSGDETSSLSGYDSDGDTTDDDIPPPQTVSRPKTILHSPTRTPQVKATPKAFPRNRRQARRGPVMGSFQAVEGKPFAYYDATAKRLRIVNTPRRAIRPLHSAGSSASNSPHVTFNGVEYESDSTVAQMPLSLFPGNLDVMMSGVFGGPPGQRFQNGRFVNNTADLYGGSFGAPEAFFAQQLESLSEEGSDYSTETNSSAAQIDVLSDFLHMEELDPSDTDAEQGGPGSQRAPEDSPAPMNDGTPDTRGDEQANPESKTSPGFGKPKASSRGARRGRNLSSSMLAHFDRGVVGSFRNNQDRCRMLSRLPHDGINTKALRAGKSAMDVMTPPRRKRGRRRGLR